MNLHKAFLVLFAIYGAAIANDKPNVVFILTDDQRGDAVGYHKNPLLGIKNSGNQQNCC